MIARPLLLAALLSSSAFTHGPARAQTPEIVDTLFMNDAAGTRRAGRIVGIDAATLKLEVPLAIGGAPGAKAIVAVPRAQISRIEFAPNENRGRLVASPTAANLIALNVEWLRWKPFLAVPKSPSGAVAVAFGAALLSTNDPKRAADALELFKRVEQAAWNDADRQAAKQGRLRAMVATGHAAEAVAEATELARASEDSTVLVEAKFILAEAAQASLRKLVADNPRWTEDPRVRPEHDRLYNEALDLYLYPSLFLGSETEAASRGLWGATRIYRFGGDNANAIEAARDLTALYPSTRYAALAQQYLDGLPETLKKPPAGANSQP
ncbi:MAG: hypothetical protein PHC88_10630 [Terrimicrobiaceae bacterium]|nr:hypothetical protein [Terrimicrobiaceae bacterium]